MVGIVTRCPCVERMPDSLLQGHDSVHAIRRIWPNHFNVGGAPRVAYESSIGREGRPGRIGF